MVAVRNNRRLTGRTGFDRSHIDRATGGYWHPAVVSAAAHIVAECDAHESPDAYRYDRWNNGI